MCGHNNITFFYETNSTFKLQGYPFFFFSIFKIWQLCSQFCGHSLVFWTARHARYLRDLLLLFIYIYPIVVWENLIALKIRLGKL